MALSLAACGGSSTTTTTPVVETPVVDTPVTPVVDAAKALSLTAVADTMVGGSGNDTIENYTNSGSWTAADSIDGGAGTDTLILHLGATATPVTTSIENLDLRASTAITVTVSSVDGLTSIVNDDSAGTLTLAGVSGQSVTVQNLTAENTVINWTDATGATDAQVLNIKGDNGDVTVDGVETVTVTGAAYAGSTGATIDLLDSNALKTVTIESSVAVNLGVVTQGAAATKTLTLDGSKATGGFTADISDFNGTATTGNTVTGSAGADTIEMDVGDITKYEVHAMGAGDDTLIISDEYNDADTAKADLANMTGYTSLHLRLGTDATGTDALTLDSTEGLDWVTKVIVDDVEGNFKKVSDGTTFEVSAGKTVDDLQIVSYAVAGVNGYNLVLKGGATVSDLIGATTGTVNITSSASASSSVNTVTVIANSTATKLVIDGNEALDLDGAGSAALDTTTVEVDATALTDDLDVLASASATLIKGGSGDDTIVGGGAADTLYGNAGADTVTGGAGTDTIYGGAGNDTMDGGAGADTIDAGDGDDSIAIEVHATNVNTVTGGSGSDTFTFNVDGTPATAFADNVITDFNSGTATTAVDKISIDITAIEALTEATDMTDTSANSVGAGAVAVKTVTADGAVITDADVVILSQTYATEGAALLGMATGGADTFQFGSALTDLDTILVAFSDGTDSYIAAVGADTGTNSGTANSTSDSFDHIEIFVKLSGVSDLSTLDASDFVFI